MRLLPKGQAQVVRKVMPRSLLGRSLLIMLVPLIVVQAVAMQLFYGSNLDIVSRRFAGAVAGEIAVTAAQMERYTALEDRAWAMQAAWERLELAMRFHPALRLEADEIAHEVSRTGPLVLALQERVQRPFALDWKAEPRSILIRVQMGDGVLDVLVPVKRLNAGTVYLFMIWLVGSSLLLFTIAALFMRNQMRALRRLAAAAEAFGIGRDTGPIKPEGAAEIRQAASAFNRMQERIRRFLQQRTEMLAGVSHDLRTPLTRLRLALALYGHRPDLAEDIAEMEADIGEMDRMIDGYLAFARGEGSEQARLTDLVEVLRDAASSARRAGAEVTFAPQEPLLLSLRPDAMRRAITNLLDNARRHASHITLALHKVTARAVEVVVDDDGPGIPPERRESVFRPFASGAAGGTGLGLTIAQDIVRAHGGDITLDTSPSGGLRARVRLPI